jgi:phosphonate transport system ATP-binding protein
VTSAGSRSKTIDGSGSPLLRLTNCTVRYNGGQPAVDSLSLEIGASERVALVGPSGAGKTTIIGLANGTVMPTNGIVEILGVDSSNIVRREHRTARRKVATVHQDFALVPSLRVFHNVAAGRLGYWSIGQALRSLVRPAHRQEVLAVLKDVGIPEKLWERTDSLSGGQQQRVAIARALYQDPELLLADEPVSNLDPARSKAILDVLVAAAESSPTRTLIASIHDAPLAQSHFDRIVGMKHGQLVFDLPGTDVTADLLDSLYAIDDEERLGKETRGKEVQ